MINAVHVTTAAAIVTVIPNPVVSLPLALASHLLLDSVPHWNWSPGRTWRGRVASIGDGAAAIGLTLWFASLSLDPAIMILACLLSMAPDLIQGPYHFWGWKPRLLVAYIGWERRRQKWPWMNKWVGIGTQVVTLIVALAIIFTFL